MNPLCYTGRVAVESYMTISASKEKTVVYLMKSDKEQLKERAASSGLSVSTYVSALVRNNLKSDPDTVVNSIAG